MTESGPQSNRIDLANSDDPRDVVHRVVESLAGGAVVGLPIGPSYAIACSALRPEGVGRLLDAIGGDRASEEWFTGPWICLRGDEELPDWSPSATSEMRRIASRAWPGPVTLVSGNAQNGLASRLPSETQQAVIVDNSIALCCPRHPLISQVVNLLSGPIALFELMDSEGKPITTPSALLDQVTVDLLIDDGPVLGQTGTTVLDVRGQTPEMLRGGALGEDDLPRLWSTVILFVCTGNTCRSPMAEALCKAMLAQRLGCSIDELAQRGWVVQSAGLATGDGLPASPEAVQAIRDLGGSLENHQSRRLTPRLVRQADHILVMTSSHLEAMQSHLSKPIAHAQLLDPAGEDLSDPYGADLSVYRATADAVRRHLAQWLDRIVA